jgi:hypothetical protein
VGAAASLQKGLWKFANNLHEQGAVLVVVIVCRHDQVLRVDFHSSEGGKVDISATFACLVVEECPLLQVD